MKFQLFLVNHALPLYLYWKALEQLSNVRIAVCWISNLTADDDLWPSTIWRRRCSRNNLRQPGGAGEDMPKMRPQNVHSRYNRAREAIYSHVQPPTANNYISRPTTAQQTAAEHSRGDIVGQSILYCTTKIMQYAQMHSCFPINHHCTQFDVNASIALSAERSAHWLRLRATKTGTLLYHSIFDP